MSFHYRTNVLKIIFIKYLYNNIISFIILIMTFYVTIGIHTTKRLSVTKIIMQENFEILVKDLPFLKTLRTPS